MSSFTHLDADDRPGMVDVGDKDITKRVAIGAATVILGADIMQELIGSDFSTKKGSIFQTAILAATMAVKNTWATIPLCHAIPISGCKVAITVAEPTTADAPPTALDIRCKVRTEGRTGVEMEALHGASVAALTIYDMCKAMSHDIQIEHIHLVSKSGGKSDYHAPVK